MKFNIGDKVCWLSQSAGTWKEKVGVVEAVISAGVRPKIKNCGIQRNHESYVVRVREGKRSKAYWPRVHGLAPWNGLTVERAK